MRCNAFFCSVCGDPKYSKNISNGTFMRFCGVLPCTMIGPHYWCLSERRPTHQLLLSFGKSPQELSYTNFGVRFSGVFKKIYIYCVLEEMTTNKREYNVHTRIYSMLEAPCHCIQVDKTMHTWNHSCHKFWMDFPTNTRSQRRFVSFNEELAAT